MQLIIFYPGSLEFGHLPELSAYWIDIGITICMYKHVMPSLV